MSSVPPEANHSIIGNIGVKNRCLPSQVWYHSRIGSPQLHQNLMMVTETDFSARLSLDTQSIKCQSIALGRVPYRLERKDGAFQLKFLYRLEVGV